MWSCLLLVWWMSPWVEGVADTYETRRYMYFSGRANACHTCTFTSIITSLRELMLVILQRAEIFLTHWHSKYPRATSDKRKLMMSFLFTFNGNYDILLPSHLPCMSVRGLKQKYCPILMIKIPLMTCDVAAEPCRVWGSECRDAPTAGGVPPWPLHAHGGGRHPLRVCGQLRPGCAPCHWGPHEHWGECGLSAGEDSIVIISVVVGGGVGVDVGVSFVVVSEY